MMQNSRLIRQKKENDAFCYGAQNRIQVGRGIRLACVRTRQLSRRRYWGETPQGLTTTCPYYNNTQPLSDWRGLLEINLAAQQLLYQEHESITYSLESCSFILHLSVMCRVWREVGIIDHLQGLMGPPGQPSPPPPSFSLSHARFDKNDFQTVKWNQICKAY